MSSLQYHFDNLTDSLDKLNIRFEVNGISENRIKKDNPPLSNVSFQVCKTEYIPGILSILYCTKKVDLYYPSTLK